MINSSAQAARPANTVLPIGLLRGGAGLSARCIDPVTLWFVGTLAIIPLFSVSIPPLLDYPGHLAHVAIVADMVRGGRFFSQVYDLNEILMPNLGFDVIALLLIQICGPYIAGLLSLVVIQGLTLSGIAALSRAIHGQIQLTALLGGIFINNWIFALGFLSYLTGIGLMFWAIAAFVRNAHYPVWRQTLSLTAYALLVYASHFMAFAAYALATGLLILGEAVTSKAPLSQRALSFFARGIPLAVPVFIYAIAYVLNDARDDHTDQGAFAPNWAGYVLDLGYKIKVVWECILSGDLIADLLTLSVLALALAFILLRGSLGMDRRFLLPIGALVLVTFVAPFIMGSAAYIDQRLTIPPLYLAIAATRISLPRNGARLLRNALIILIAVRSLVFVSAWQTSQTAFERYRAAFAMLPRHSTLYFATGEPGYCPGHGSAARRLQWAVPSLHINGLASIDREIFVPDLWAEPTQHLIVRKPQYVASYNGAFGPDLAVIKLDLGGFIEKIRSAHRAGAIPGGGPVFLMIVHGELIEGGAAPQLPLVVTGDNFAIYSLAFDPAVQP